MYIFICVLRNGMKMEVKVVRSCPGLIDPVNCTVQGVLQARILEWVATSPGDLPDPGIVPESPARQADSLLMEPSGKPKKWNISCQIGKRRTLESSATIATEDGALASLEGTQEGKDTRHLAAIRLQPAPHGDP